jgi:hypothetical protein
MRQLFAVLLFFLWCYLALDSAAGADARLSLPGQESTWLIVLVVLPALIMILEIGTDE